MNILVIMCTVPPYPGRYRDLERRLAEAEREKQELLGTLSGVRSQLTDSKQGLQEAQREREEAVSKNREVCMCVYRVGAMVSSIECCVNTAINAAFNLPVHEPYTCVVSVGLYFIQGIRS